MVLSTVEPFPDPTSKSILCLATSVPDSNPPDPVVPAPVSSHVRATLEMATWIVEPVLHSDDISVTYYVQTNPSGWIPRAILSRLSAQFPTCIHYVHEFLENYGAPPYLLGHSHDRAREIIKMTRIDYDHIVRSWTAEYQLVQRSDSIEPQFEEAWLDIRIDHAAWLKPEEHAALELVCEKKMRVDVQASLTRIDDYIMILRISHIPQSDPKRILHLSIRPSPGRQPILSVHLNGRHYYDDPVRAEPSPSNVSPLFKSETHTELFPPVFVSDLHLLWRTMYDVYSSPMQHFKTIWARSSTDMLTIQLHESLGIIRLCQFIPDVEPGSVHSFYSYASMRNMWDSQNFVHGQSIALPDGTVGVDGRGSMDIWYGIWKDRPIGNSWFSSSTPVMEQEAFVAQMTRVMRVRAPRKQRRVYESFRFFPRSGHRIFVVMSSMDELQEDEELVQYVVSQVSYPPSKRRRLDIKGMLVFEPIWFDPSNNRPDRATTLKYRCLMGTLVSWYCAAQPEQNGTAWSTWIAGGQKFPWMHDNMTTVPRDLSINMKRLEYSVPHIIIPFRPSNEDGTCEMIKTFYQNKFIHVHLRLLFAVHIEYLNADVHIKKKLTDSLFLPLLYKYMRVNRMWVDRIGLREVEERRDKTFRILESNHDPHRHIYRTKLRILRDPFQYDDEETWRICRIDDSNEPQVGFFLADLVIDLKPELFSGLSITVESATSALISVLLDIRLVPLRLHHRSAYSIFLSYRPLPRHDMSDTSLLFPLDFDLSVVMMRRPRRVVVAGTPVVILNNVPTTALARHPVWSRDVHDRAPGIHDSDSSSIETPVPDTICSMGKEVNRNRIYDIMEWVNETVQVMNTDLHQLAIYLLVAVLSFAVGVWIKDERSR